MKKRFLNQTNAAKALKVDKSTITRLLRNKTIAGDTHQVYIKHEGEFHEVKGSEIQVVDMSSVKKKKTYKFVSNEGTD